MSAGITGSSLLGTRQRRGGECQDTFSESNFLTRGQEAAVKIDESKVVHVELAPGQASFHHGRLLHASAPNCSDERRIGLVVNYIAPHVRQTVARRDYAMLVRVRKF